MQSRRPLPPFDMVGPYHVHTTLPSNLMIPPQPDIRFMRGDAWGVEVPEGLPFVPGGTSSKFPNRALTWFLDEYAKRSSTSVDDILTAHAVRGYTDFLLSRGGGFGQQSPEAYAAMASEVQSWGFWVSHMLTSKDIDPISASAAYYVNAVQPYLDVLLSIGAADKICLGWELNLFWDPTELLKFKQWLRAYVPANIPIAAHFSTYVTAWQLPGQSRDAFWNDGLVQELWYQTDPFVNLGTRQAHANDAMVTASGLQANSVRLVVFEVDAAAQFDGPDDEDVGNMYTYGMLCTPGPWPFNGGYMGGTRRPTGASL